MKDHRPGAAGAEAGARRADARPTSREGRLPDALGERLAEQVHDLRDPINVIAMNVQLLELLTEEASGTELGEALGALERAVLEAETRLAALGGTIAEAREAGRGGER